MEGSEEEEARFERNEFAPDAIENGYRFCSERRTSIEVHGFRLYPVLASEEDGLFGATGGELWEASVLLAQALPAVFHGVAMEVGAGLGLPGMTFARRGQRVLLTDVDRGVVRNLERQIQDNGISHVAKAQLFDLNDDKLPKNVDLLLAADVVYSPHLANRLANIVKIMPATIILQRKGRPGFDDVFLPALQNTPGLSFELTSCGHDFLLCRTSQDPVLLAANQFKAHLNI